MNLVILILIGIFSYTSFIYGRSRIKKITTSQSIKINALPNYYGYYLALWCALPSLIILLVWSIFEASIIKGLISQTLRRVGSIVRRLLNTPIRSYIAKRWMAKERAAKRR